MDWGLGHATRCVPIIENILKLGANVIIGADNKPLDFLRLQFPLLPWIRISGFKPEYQKKGRLLTLKLASDLPKMMKIVKPIQKHLEKIIITHNIDAVISDNRYELWSEQAPTIFMTHQLNIMTKGVLLPLRPAIQKFIYSFIEKHNELWIPDFDKKNNLSGDLSHVSIYPNLPFYFIGPLSRFKKPVNVKHINEKYDVVCIMSGPEPQRTIFEKLLIKQLLQTEYKSIIFSGNPDKNEKRDIDNVKIISHMSDEEMNVLISAAKIVISRSGYSTLMDMSVFGKKALLVPTPGQPEQEYLAELMMKAKYYYSVSQNKLNLISDIPVALTFSGTTMYNDYTLLKSRIEKLINFL